MRARQEIKTWKRYGETWPEPAREVPEAHQWAELLNRIWMLYVSFSSSDLRLVSWLNNKMVLNRIARNLSGWSIWLNPFVSRHRAGLSLGRSVIYVCKTACRTTRKPFASNKN